MNLKKTLLAIGATAAVAAPSHAVLIYTDADQSNTLLPGGGAVPVESASNADWYWRTPVNDVTGDNWFENQLSTNGIQSIVMTVAAADGIYDVYLGFASFGASGGNWDITGALPGGSAQTFDVNTSGVFAAQNGTGETDLATGINPRGTYFAPLGQVTVSGGQFEVTVSNAAGGGRSNLQGVGLVAAVPEPSSALLAGLGLLGLARRRRA